MLSFTPLRSTLFRGFNTPQKIHNGRSYTTKTFEVPVSLNPRVKDLPLSPTLALNEKSKLLEAQGMKVMKWGFGQSPFPVPEPLQKGLRENTHQKDYLPAQGLWALRESIAGWLNRENPPVQYGPEDIVIGPGTKELMFQLQLVHEGKLLIPKASWVSYEPQAMVLGKSVTWLDTSFAKHWKLTPKELEKALIEDERHYNDHNHVHPRLLILNTPGNPTGMCYTPKELEALGQVAHRFGLLILSDEIYGGLHFTEKHPPSISHYYPSGTIRSQGLSKHMGAGGWRLGFFAFPKELKWLQRPLVSLITETFSAVSAPIQYAAIAAFEPSREIDRYLELSRKILHSLSRKLVDILVEGGIKVHYPEGGFYFFLSFADFAKKLQKRNITSDIILAEEILSDTKVALLPGSNFGVNSTEYTFRAAYVNFDGAKALTDLEKMKTDQIPEGYVEEMCSEAFEAAKALRDWAKQL